MRTCIPTPNNTGLSLFVTLVCLVSEHCYHAIRARRSSGAAPLVPSGQSAGLWRQGRWFQCLQRTIPNVQLYLRAVAGRDIPTAYVHPLNMSAIAIALGRGYRALKLVPRASPRSVAVPFCLVFTRADSLSARPSAAEVLKLLDEITCAFSSPSSSGFRAQQSKIRSSEVPACEECEAGGVL